MQTSSHRLESEAQLLRKKAGRWLKQKREEQNLSQRQLADRVGIGYYTFISQLESGRGRIPPERYADWAKALDIPPKTFVCTLMRYYEPTTYSILFPEDATSQSHAEDNGLSHDLA